MANLKNLKEKISSFKKTAKVTRAMESISAIKMRKAQEEAINARFYAYKIFGILKRLSKISKNDLDELFKEEISEKGKTLILFITPDKELTGGMNVFLNKKLMEIIKKKKFKNDEIEFVVVGKKGYEFLKKNNFNILKYFVKINEKSDLETVREVSEFIKKTYLKEKDKYKEVISIYTEFINTSEQKPKTKVILPIIYNNLKDFIKSIKPTKGKYSDLTDIDIDDKDVPDYIFEPDFKEVLKNFIPFILNIEVYYSLLESFASEHSSRMVAMKNATEKALEKEGEARKKFNKERQATITQEISEIVSGIEAMK